MRRGTNAMRSSKPRAASTHQTEDEDPPVQMMLLDGIPLTRVNYLNLACMGQVPKRLSAEELWRGTAYGNLASRIPRRRPTGPVDGWR